MSLAKVSPNALLTVLESSARSVVSLPMEFSSLSKNDMSLRRRDSNRSLRIRHETRSPTCEVPLHKGKLRREKALIAGVEVGLRSEHKKVGEALVEGVVARRARARVCARKERHGAEARLVLGEVLPVALA